MFFRRFIGSLRTLTLVGFGFGIGAHSALSQTVDLVLSGSSRPEPVTTGQTLTYFLNVTNVGTSAATGVHLTDLLPTKLAYTSSLPTQGSCSHSNGIVNCDLENLDPR